MQSLRCIMIHNPVVFNSSILCCQREVKSSMYRNGSSVTRTLGDASVTLLLLHGLTLGSLGNTVSAHSGLERVEGS